MTQTSRSVKHTERIAGALAEQLKPNDVVALHGDLGAGKTQFVRGLLAGLGGEPRSVSSPTFVLLNVYDTGRLPVFHLDAYRVSGPEDFEGIGFAELLEQGGVVVVEWPTRVATLLPGHTIHVTLEPTAQRTRKVTITRPTAPDAECPITGSPPRRR